jgi:hypothetical protein
VPLTKLLPFTVHVINAIHRRVTWKTHFSIPIYFTKTHYLTRTKFTLSNKFNVDMDVYELYPSLDPPTRRACSFPVPRLYLGTNDHLIFNLRDSSRRLWDMVVTTLFNHHGAILEDFLNLENELFEFRTNAYPSYGLLKKTIWVQRYKNKVKASLTRIYGQKTIWFSLTSQPKMTSPQIHVSLSLPPMGKRKEKLTFSPLAFGCCLGRYFVEHRELKFPIRCQHAVLYYPMWAL